MKKIFLALFLVAVFWTFTIPSYAEEKKLEIKDGILRFPEANLQTVALSRLTLSFPPDSPQEFLKTKGKIFRGELKRDTGRRVGTNLTYLIPLAYNSDTKEIAVYCVLEKGYGSGYETKPAQGRLLGVFDLENGTDLRWQRTDIKTQIYRLHFLKNGLLRVNRSDGWSADYVPVGQLPE